MTTSQKMLTFAGTSSWIRKMFEEGSRMKAQFSAENVFDFSLGNPDLPPPPQFSQVLAGIVCNPFRQLLPCKHDLSGGSLRSVNKSASLPQA
ncbi:MAG: hypothetical protein ACTFAK_02610 [Candidatus Electronema sp. VV]